MKEKGLILNKSYDDFELGSNVIRYCNIPHQIDKHEEPYIWECYTFIQHDIKYELWCDNSIIKNICCNQSCIFKGQELINMEYKKFLCIINEVPISHDVTYVLVSKDRGQNQHVYDFDKSGLQVWVWRGKIRTIVIYDSNADEN